jgi:choline dehydrogenase-like flavoprotein
MAAGNWIVYDSFKLWMADGTFDMDADTFKITLHTNTYTPLLTHTVYADLANELATANGYTNGGAALVTPTWTKSGSTTTFDAVDPTWTAAGGSIGPFRKAVIRKSGTANGHVDPLVAYCILDSADITLTDTTTFTIQLNASGILTVTGAIS